VILITEIESPVLDGILNYFRLKEIVIEEKLPNGCIGIGITGRASGAKS
jgi:hypothetical protein